MDFKLEFGKYKDKSISEVIEEDQNYLYFIMCSEEPNGNVKMLIKHIEKNKVNIMKYITFGKFKGKPFDDVLKNHADWLVSMMKIDEVSRGSPLEQLQRYIRKNNIQLPEHHAKQTSKNTEADEPAKQVKKTCDSVDNVTVVPVPKKQTKKVIAKVHEKESDSDDDMTVVPVQKKSVKKLAPKVPAKVLEKASDSDEDMTIVPVPKKSVKKI